MRSFRQLVLDLFEPAPARESSAAQAASAQSDPIVMPGGLPPLRFAHPRANRQTHLCNVQVAYEFKRGRRRTIGMQVGADGLEVSAPRWVPLVEVEAALQEKGAWIVRKLDEMRERSRRLEDSRIHWGDGVSLPYLGESLRVVLDPGAGSFAMQDQPLRELRIALPQGALPEQIRDAVQAWLMRQARDFFTQRLEHFAPRLGVRWTKLSLSSANTRWGSAGADGAIRLNWRLIHFRQELIDYVVAHELSHLRVMNHSPQFWDTLASVVPEHSSLRRQLRDDALPRW
ncbi:MAG: hypothetical protein RLZZ596_1923 [Pseudomonadota bacterium]|jgi:predicted metal-dependent hydrolase